MNTLQQKRQSRAARRAGVRRASALAMAIAMGYAKAATPLADQPVFTISSVPGNVALALSVEFPTAVSVAHQGAFVAGKEYVGYFDPEKCYKYQQGTEVGNDLSHFYPVSMATARKCTAAGDTWSGNFLNWLTMQAIDPFRWTLTGGLRVVDTPSTTILERAWAPSNGNNGDDNNFPLIPTTGTGNALKNRPSPTSTEIDEHTPLTYSSLKVSVRGRGNKVRFTKDGDLNIAAAIHYSQAVVPAAGSVYEFYVRVKVCATGAGFGVEDNCTPYAGGNSKPEGLLQQYAEKMRFSAFGYLNDYTDSNRDGGVMRARQKYVGPNLIRPSQPTISNPNNEWDATTGVFITNPDPTDATNTNADFNVTIANSGVINYVNKFGQQYQSYKRRDPVSELYYGVLRYLKNQGPIPDWTAGVSGAANRSQLVDGFPVITRWDDPIQFSCQRNFVVGIGDTNTNWDRNLPGSTVFSNEPSLPAAVTADNTTNAQTATNKVGSLHGLGASLGTAAVSNGSYLIAGLAYDANTRDIRPDDPSKPNTKDKQTVRTYWLDVLEFGDYLANNQYYLAAKFGGFKVPKNYNPDTQSTDLPQAWWTTTSTTVGSGQPRPDTYYTVANPSQMISGLKSAFASIASDLRAYTTSFTTALPRVAFDGVASYATTYDASGWTGDLIASTATFDSGTGEPTITDAWSFRTKLTAQLSGTGWDTNRRVITFNPTTGVGAPFRSGNLTATQLTALDTIYRGGNDSADYLKYLRGDTTHEVGSTAAGSARIYRYREALVGDIVGSKARPVGPPASSLSEAANTGYTAFKTLYAARPTMVYFGTNAGMLHAVYGKTDGAPGGTELFAYVPNMLYQGPTATPAVNGLQSVGDPEFAHHAMVDASPVSFDIDFGRTVGGSGTSWRTLLVGGLGKGGKGYYAVDVTNPAGMTTEATAAGKVLWEFTDADLGYTYGEPVMVKTSKYGWVLIFGSGYNNSTGQGYFFIVNPRTGALLEKVATGAGGAGVDAGLAHVQAFVLDRTDGTADTVYGGDLLGNLWRLDVRGAAAYAAPVKLAELKDADNNPLPMTSRPLVVVQPGTNKRFVTVGTGRLLATGDVGSTQSQAFFAIIDGTGLQPGTAAQLPAGVSYPVVKSNLKQLVDLTQKVTIDPATHVGWWYDLGVGAGNLGWRVIIEPTAFNGIVAFTSMVPSGEVCSPSGSSRVYAIDLGTGQSMLTSGNSTVAFLNSVSGVVGDLRFYSVSGKPRLIAGSDKGEVKNQSGTWTTGLGVRRLNWRELPLAD
jgi:type IV pilus assembly protein PilY1